MGVFKVQLSLNPQHCSQADTGILSIWLVTSPTGMESA